MNRWPSIATVLLLVLSPLSLHAQSAPDSILKAFHLETVSAQSLERTLTQLFSADIRIAADNRANMLLVRGTHAQLEEVEALVRMVDQPREQPPALPAERSDKASLADLQQQFRDQ
jgi:type II secretory pathway component GspD/PulD (secretin)